MGPGHRHAFEAAVARHHYDRLGGTVRHSVTKGEHMTTLLPITDIEAGTDEAGPGCGCCVPPPDASAKQEALAALQARRDAVERRLAGIGPARV